MRYLAEIMSHAGTPHPFRSEPQFWSLPEWESTINHAHRLGLVYRSSYSQVEWTEKGIAFYHKYIN